MSMNMVYGLPKLLLYFTPGDVEYSTDTSHDHQEWRPIHLSFNLFLWSSASSGTEVLLDRLCKRKTEQRVNVYHQVLSKIKSALDIHEKFCPWSLED